MRPAWACRARKSGMVVQGLEGAGEGPGLGGGEGCRAGRGQRPAGEVGGAAEVLDGELQEVSSAEASGVGRTARFAGVAQQGPRGEGDGVDHVDRCGTVDRR